MISFGMNEKWSFQVPPYLRPAIYQHAVEAFPEEMVGYIARAEDCNQLQYHRLTNAAPEDMRDNAFTLDPAEWERVLEAGNAVALVHSHTKGQRAPSREDMVGQRKTGLPWVIVVLTDADTIIDEFSFPIDRDAPIEGLDFRAGVADCVETISRYYWHKHGVVIDGGPRDDEWWLGSEDNPEDAPDMFLDLYEREGFRRLAPHEVHENPEDPNSPILLRAGDVGLTRVMSPHRLNHGVIYTGGQMMLHHLLNRVSREEPISRWLPRIEVWLRHKALDEEKPGEDDPSLRRSQQDDQQA